MIVENFHVDVEQGKDVAGKERPPIRKYFTKGMVIAVDQLPQGHSAQDWIDKGLAKAASTEKAAP